MPLLDLLSLFPFAMSPRQIHSVRLYSPPPSSVHCLAIQEEDEEQDNKTKTLALSRADNAIEIW